MISRWLTLLCLASSLVSARSQTPARPLRDALDQALQAREHPQQAAEFKPAPHLPARNQGQTFICWSYATTSFLESEMLRLKRPSVRLSVMFPVYCQYLEKARTFAQTQGASRFEPGDLFSGVLNACRQYGAMPAGIYDKTPGDQAPDHTRLYADLDKLIQEVKLRGDWDETVLLARVKDILNRHLGQPPKSFFFDGKTYTPKSFLDDVVRLPWDDYVLLMSTESAPFHALAELKVPDNWQHITNFFNLPLAEFYSAFKDALQNGFTLATDIDVTEPIYRDTGRYGVIPDFDLPPALISQHARELRLANGATTDDHVVHTVGCRPFGTEDWFYALDSGKPAWRDTHRGDLFLQGAYVKLKVLAVLVHRDAVPSLAKQPR